MLMSAYVQRRAGESVPTGSTSVCARRYVVPIAWASSTTSARRHSSRLTARLSPKASTRPMKPISAPYSTPNGSRCSG